MFPRRRRKRRRRGRSRAPQISADRKHNVWQTYPDSSSAHHSCSCWITIWSTTRQTGCRTGVISISLKVHLKYFVGVIQGNIIITAIIPISFFHVPHHVVFSGRRMLLCGLILIKTFLYQQLEFECTFRQTLKTRLSLPQPQYQRLKFIPPNATIPYIFFHLVGH